MIGIANRNLEDFLRTANKLTNNWTSLFPRRETKWVLTSSTLCKCQKGSDKDWLESHIRFRYESSQAALMKDGLSLLTNLWNARIPTPWLLVTDSGFLNYINHNSMIRNAYSQRLSHLGSSTAHRSPQETQQSELSSSTGSSTLWDPGSPVPPETSSEPEQTRVWK